MSAAICHFPAIAGAVNATIQVIQMGVPIARCELLDANAIRAVNAHDKLSLREQPMLLMEFHGSPAGVQEQAETVQAIAAERGVSKAQVGLAWVSKHPAVSAPIVVSARLAIATSSPRPP